MIALEAALPSLIDLLDDPDPEVMTASIWALGEIGGDEARYALEPLLDDDEIGGLAQDALDAMDLMTGPPSFDRYSTGT
jgi:HEAT repeat protein